MGITEEKYFLFCNEQFYTTVHTRVKVRLESSEEHSSASGFLTLPPDATCVEDFHREHMTTQPRVFRLIPTDISKCIKVSL